MWQTPFKDPTLMSFASMSGGCEGLCALGKCVFLHSQFGDRYGLSPAALSLFLLAVFAARFL